MVISKATLFTNIVVKLFCKERLLEMLRRGYTILEHFAYPMGALQRESKALSQVNYFETSTLEELEAFMLFNFSEQDVLK